MAIVLPLLLGVGIMTGCVNKEKLDETLNDTVTNSEVGQVQEVQNKATQIGLQGSINVLPLMLELTKGLTYDVVAVGKEAAIENVIAQASQLALFDGQLDEAPGLSQIIAYAGITLIVNSKSGLENVTSEEVRAFFTGETTGIAGENLTMVLPANSAPSRSLFEGFFSLRGDSNGMQKSLIPDGVLTVETDAQVITAVMNEKNAIGVILTGSLDARVKGLKLEGIEANVSTLADGTYIAAVPIVLMSASNEERFLEFIEITKSEHGKEVIKKIGFTTIN